jgi:chromosome segregation ATPase
MEERVTKLETTTNNLTYDIATVRELVRSNAGSLKVLEATLNTGVGQMRDYQAHNDRRFDRIEEIATQANDRVHGLLDVVNAIEDRLTIRIDRVEESLAATKQEVGSLKEEVGSLKQEVGSLKQEVGSLSTKVEGIEVLIREVLDRLPPKATD